MNGLQIGARMVLVLTLAAGVGLVLDYTGAIASGGTGTVTGVVYEDLNSDGVRQPEEPGLAGRTLTIDLDGGGTLTGDTNGEGAFAIGGVPAGSHTISTELDDPGPLLCADSFGGFHPLRVDDCYPVDPEYFSATTPESTNVVVADGQQVVVNFGGRRADIRGVTGIALLGGDYAPVGTEIVAKLAGVECGSTLVEEPGGQGNVTYLLPVFGGLERVGCPTQEGEQLDVEVGGVPAAEHFIWLSTGISGGNLTAMPDHAWYWTETMTETSPYEGQTVIAMVGDTVCGEAEVVQGSHVFQTVFGFTRLAVPSTSVTPGCGTPGETVEFHLGDQVVAVEWQPGVHDLELALAAPGRWGDLDCDGSVSTRDNQALLREILEQAALAQTEPCPEIGSVLEVEGYGQRAWGDLDCDHEITTRDNQALLREVLEQTPLDQEEPCPNVGAPINNGAVQLTMTDNAFDPADLRVERGAALALRVRNDGAAIHNIRIAGDDNEYDTADDAVSNPDIILGGGVGFLDWTAPDGPAEIDFRCDFHPTDMVGVIHVE